MSITNQAIITQMKINIIPQDVFTEIGKYLNNRSLYNLLSSSKYNFNTQKIELENRYQSLLKKYNREEMVKKYCKNEHTVWYIEVFNRIKNEKKWAYSIVSDAVDDLHNIIKLIMAGYKEYKQDMTDIIFILMPWSIQNPKLLYFLKKMLKFGILDTHVTNMSGAYPIGHAVAYNNYETVKILVEYGNGLEPITNSHLESLISISKKNSDIYTYLIRHKMKRLDSRTKEVQKIVDYMLDVCGKKLLGFPRGNFNLPGNNFVANYMFKDVGPSWACNEPIVLDTNRLQRLRKEGIVCIGLVSVLLRCVLKTNKKMPSLDPDNYGEYKNLELYSKNKKDINWKGTFSESIAFGLNDTTEWLYIYTYGGQKGKIKPFSKSELYPRGTLLFHTFDPYTNGHIAIVYTHKIDYNNAKIFHTIGGNVGGNKVAIESLSYSHEYFSRGKSWDFDWDKDDKYGTKFYTKDCKPMPYYTHVLLPEDYIDTNVFTVPSSCTKDS